MQIPISRASPEQLLIERKLKYLLPNGCQKILLVEPPNVPEEDWDPDVAANNRYPVYDPYGLGVLSSCIELRGYTTDIIDLNFMIQDSFKGSPETFRYGGWEEWLRSKLNRFRPDVVAVTCMFTIYHRSMIRVARLIKEFDSNTVVIAGGVHTTMASTDIKNSPGQLVLEDCKEIDFVGLYEGNDSFPDFLDIANNKLGSDNLTQIATLCDNKYVAITKRAEPRSETLNVTPNYHSLPIERYSSIGRIGTFYWLFKPETRAATILINRGCRARCRFCSVEKFNGPGVVLRRDKDRVIEELKRLRDRGITYFMALDDDLFNGPIVEIFNEMERQNLGMNWDASNGVIASALTEEIADAAARSGCSALSFGIESGNPLVLKNIPKPSGVKHYLRAGEIMKKYPQIFTKGLLMVGFPPEPERNFPGESINMIWDTIHLAKQMNLDWYTIQPLNLIPGVDITNHALARGEINKQELIDGTERPVVGSTGKQDRRTKHEKSEALPFINHLATEDLDRIPERDELIDIWFVMDYMVNYEKLWQLEDPIKIGMLHKLFISMCDKTHKENALGNLFFALLEYKLGSKEQANYRLRLAREFSQDNAYWRKRFPTLGLDALIVDLELKISEIE